MQGEIYTALAKVMAAVGAVTKSKKNASQGYSFRGIDDVVAHVQQVMAEAGVLCVPRVIEREREVMTTKNGGAMASVRLLVEHTFYAKDGSSVLCTTLGEAMDSGDKASNKAMSAALKYALTETLLIPTYEVDRDTEEASPVIAAPAPPPQMKPQPPSPRNRMPIHDVGETVEQLRAALEQAPNLNALALLAARIQPRPEGDKPALRVAYEARAKVLMNGART